MDKETGGLINENEALDSYFVKWVSYLVHTGVCAKAKEELQKQKRTGLLID